MSKHIRNNEHHNLFKEFHLAITTNNAELIKSLIVKIHVADLALIISEYKAEKN